MSHSRSSDNLMPQGRVRIHCKQLEKSCLACLKHLDRGFVAAERSNFPTDLYMLEGLIGVRGGKHELVLIDDPQDLLTGGIDLSNVAVVLLTHVSYRSGRMLPMRDITLGGAYRVRPCRK